MGAYVNKSKYLLSIEREGRGVFVVIVLRPPTMAVNAAGIVSA